MITEAEAVPLSDSVTEPESDLSSLTIAQLKELASENGYEVTKTKKADIIAEIEAQMQ